MQVGQQPLCFFSLFSLSYVLNTLLNPLLILKFLKNLISL